MEYKTSFCHVGISKKNIKQKFEKEQFIIVLNKSTEEALILDILKLATIKSIYEMTVNRNS